MTGTASLLIELARRAGAAEAEALVKIGSTRTVSLERGGGVCWTRSAQGGVALRVFLPDGARGFASMCGPAPEETEAREAVRAAMEAARAAAPSLVLPSEKAGDGRGLGIFDPRVHTATLSDLEGLLGDAATEALRADPRVRRLDTASVAASTSEIGLVNSAGFEGTYRQTLVHLSLGVVAGEGRSSIVVKRSRTARNLAGFSPGLFGDETARLAATALQGRPPDAGVYPALLAPAAAAEILRLWARQLQPSGLAADRRSVSRLLTFIDDGRLPGGIASAPFDGEGVATRRSTVISRGVPGESLHDLASAAASGATSTGNGLRASFRDPPRRQPSNLFITPGGEDPSDLMTQLRDGLWIQSLRPAPTMVAARGEDGALTAVATGRRVIDGRMVEAIAGALVTWPIDALLAGVIGVGNDLAFGFPAGSFGSPSLLVKEIGVRES